jgi:hypothetical protein
MSTLTHFGVAPTSDILAIESRSPSFGIVDPGILIYGGLN